MRKGRHARETGSRFQLMRPILARIFPRCCREFWFRWAPPNGRSHRLRYSEVYLLGWTGPVKLSEVSSDAARQIAVLASGTIGWVQRSPRPAIALLLGARICIKALNARHSALRGAVYAAYARLRNLTAIGHLKKRTSSNRKFAILCNNARPHGPRNHWQWALSAGSSLHEP